MRVLLPCCLLPFLLLTGCSSSSTRQSKTYAAGEKATVDELTYSVIDSEFHTRLGDEATPRIPQNRFLTIQLAVSNSANHDVPIPGLALLDDSGKTYPELGDGSGVPQWLGIVRKVSPGQTERGVVLFDAPAGHYKLRLSDELSDGDVYSDIPLSFVHEQANGVGSTAESPQQPAPLVPQPDRKK